MPQRRNSKSEARNPKQCQMSQIENSKRAGFQAVHLRDLEIWIRAMHLIPLDARRRFWTRRRDRQFPNSLTLQEVAGRSPKRAIAIPQNRGSQEPQGESSA